MPRPRKETVVTTASDQESKVEYIVILDNCSRNLGMAGPFTDRAMAEKAMANALTNPNVTKAYLKTNDQ